MKYAIALFLTLAPLAACAPVTGKVTKESLSLAAPDVPQVDAETQKKAADEMERGQCPALNHLANVCLTTRDQARALSGIK